MSTSSSPRPSSLPDPLFMPFMLGELRLRNRLMISAHEPNYAIEGIPGERYIRYHEERSRGGLGLTMTAGSAIVSRDSPAAFGNLHLYSDDVVKPLSELVERCHAQGAAVMIQLTHLGRRSRWDQGDWLPLVSASGIRERAHRAFPKVFEEWDGKRIVQDYCAAAERVRAAGFDGIELEGYGHFLDSFWSPASNERADEHGISAVGSASSSEDHCLGNRLRFTKSLITALRETLGSSFILGIRMSIDERGRSLTSRRSNDGSPASTSDLPYGMESGFDEQTGLAIARELCGVEAEPRLDFLNVICGRVDTDANLSHVIPSAGMRAAPHLDFAGMVRAELKVPILHAGRVATISDARHAINEGKVDIIGMTRAHLADPHIARKTLAGLEDDIRPCVGASYCLDRLYLGQDAICIHNPASGREGYVPHDHELSELAQRDKKKGAKRRKVIIVGAGPCGLESARVSLEKGHETIVFEAAEQAGGQVRLLAQGRKRELSGIVDWRLQQIEKLKGSITYNRYAERQDILAEGADIVVIATGGVPQKPRITYGEDLAETGWEVLGGALPKFSSGEHMRIMVYDDNGAQAGVQLTETLAQAATESFSSNGDSFCEILYVTPERELAPDIGGMTHAEVARVFCENDVKVEINSRLVGLERRGNRLRVELGSDYALEKRRFLEVDRIFVEHATSPNCELYDDLKDLSSNLGALDHKAFISDKAQELCSNEDGEFQLFRIGDALAARNVHAAIYDALRLCKNF